MRRPTTQLTVSQPCQESWVAMTPAGPGRYCAACQQVVVDFTQKTDAEILAYLARTTAGGCGRFRADQLARPLQPATPTTRWRSWLASVLAAGGVLGGSRAAAQAGGNFHPGPVPATMQPAAPTAPAPPAPNPATPPAPAEASGPLLVRGRVVDSRNEGIPGVTVLLQGTELGISTSMDGSFELLLPATAAGSTLVFSTVGYSAQRLPVPAASATPLAVQLQENVQGLMGEVIVIGGYARKPWPWHPRSLYHWSKYQLLRPFRR